MERRAASHTEEEEMNQRRKLLNAARRGDTKAIGKLSELYQVRVLSGDQLAKVNRTSAYMAPVKSSKSKTAGKGEKTSASKTEKKSGKASHKMAVKKEPTNTALQSAKSASKHK